MTSSQGTDDAGTTYPPPGRPPSNHDASLDEDASNPDLDASVPLDVTVTDARVPFDAAGCTTYEGPPDAAAGCGFTLTLVDPRQCDFSLPGNEGSAAECEMLCGHGIQSCSLLGTNQLLCRVGCSGRRPEGLEPARPDAGSALARWFAESARLEAASVDAFRILRRELAHHGAPRGLLRAASHAARDEVRHARTTRALARRFGGRGARAKVEPRGIRALEAIALENAVEGCVKETFGALTAYWQAEKARDPQVRAAMKKIARDEARHAEISWEVARWLEPRLSPEARVRVKDAQRIAIAELEAQLSAEPPPSLVAAAGLPTPVHALRMLGELRETLWTRALAA